MTAVATTNRTSEPPRLRIGDRLRELASSRETLMDLVRKELKVKYTASALGAVWSVLNPVVFLGVFSFVVAVMNIQIPDFPVFLLSGLLVWNFFAASLQGGSRSVIDNANLVKKVAFPREILPLSAIGVAAFDFLLQSAVLWLFILVSGHGFELRALWLYPIAILTVVVFTTAVTMWLAALNVRYRDVGHLLGLGLLVWFWFTPIVYQAALVQQRLEGVVVAGLDAWGLYLVNPLAPVVLATQRALYGASDAGDPVLPTASLAWHAAIVGIVLVASVGLLLMAWRSFFVRSGDFAEEL